MSKEGLFDWQERKLSRKTAHYSTIEMARVGPLDVSIRFPNHWFGFSPSNSIRRGELIRLIREIDVSDATFAAITNSIATIITVGMNGNLTEQKERELEKTVQMVIREAIVFFSNNRDELKRTIGDDGDKKDIVRWFWQKSRMAEIQSVEDFSNYTREELCRLPRVSRDDIIDLERCLAIHGVFLKNSPLPPFQG